MAINNGITEISCQNEFEKFTCEGLSVIDFFAEWCMPCLIMAPVLEEAADKLKNKAKFAKINIDDSKAIASKHNIVTIPTTVIFKEGKEIARLIGSHRPGEIEERILEMIEQ